MEVRAQLGKHPVLHTQNELAQEMSPPVLAQVPQLRSEFEFFEIYFVPELT